MRFSSIYHYFFGLPETDLKIIEDQKARRHLLHKQINLSKIKLKKVKPIIKNGIYELEKAVNIPIPDEYEKTKINFIIKNKKFKKKSIRK